MPYFKALYFIFFKDPINNCLPYKWQVYFKLYFKNLLYRYFCKLHIKHTFQGQPFYEQANLPQNLHHFYKHMP